MSTLDAARLRALVGEIETAVVENGVDVHYFRPVRDSRPRAGNLVFVGTMNWYPNQDAMRYFLRDVWPLLLADNPERSLTVVGRDPPTEVVAAARDPRVRAPGFVPDVRTYLAEAAVYVCPIRDGGGTRLKVLDALAMAGLPVYSQPGRNGGWELLGGARTDLSGLTAAEARALFLVAGPSPASPELKAA